MNAIGISASHERMFWTAPIPHHSSDGAIEVGDVLCVAPVNDVSKVRFPVFIVAGSLYVAEKRSDGKLWPLDPDLEGPIDDLEPTHAVVSVSRSP